MIAQWFILASVIVVLVFKSCQRPKHYPPGPFCFPFIGNIPNITKHLKVFKFHHLVWQYFSKLYGPIVGLKLITGFVVLVSGKDLIKKLYVREELNGRPSGFFYHIRTFSKRLGIVMNDGEHWENQRLFSVKALKSLGLGKSNMIMHIEREVEELVKSLERNNGKEISIQMDNSNIFDVSVMNLIWTFIRGKRFELDDEPLIKLMEMVHRSFQIIDMSGGVLSQLPWIRFIAPRLSGFRPLVETMEPLWKLLKENIQEVHESYDPRTEPDNFIEIYCREIEESKDESNFFSQEQLLALCVDFFQAGSETTSNTLAFGVLYMLHYPEVMKKVQRELDTVVGPRIPTLNDRKSLKYTEATINEIQRFANVAPVGIAHRALSDVDVGGYVIPKNAIVLFNTYGMHMDEQYWDPSPKEFRPERFLNDEGELINHENFIPFGLGKRRCIGEHLAKSSLFLFFTTFLHVFDIEPVNHEQLPDLIGRDGITLSPKPFKVKLIKRQNP